MVVGSTHEKEEQRKKVNLVNMLIEGTFGEGFSGDYSIRKKNYGKGIGRIAERGSSPRIIAEENSILRRVVSLGMSGKIKGYVGVLNEDGSEITVLSNFSNQAKRYVELHTQVPEFKKKVTMKVASQVEVHDMVYPQSTSPFLEF